MNDVPYGIKIAQLARAEGELRALVALWYDSGEQHGGEVYAVINPMVEEFIRELGGYCG